MRELTWKEKIIDSQNNYSISKWCSLFENVLNHLPKIEHLSYITLKRGKCFSIEILNLSEDDSDDNVPVMDYIVTDELPKIVPEAKRVIQQIMEENGIDLTDFYYMKEDEISIDMTNIL